MFANYRSVDDVRVSIRKLIDEGDTERALRLIYDFVDEIISEPLCVSQVFSSKILDDLCQSVGSINFSQLGDSSLSISTGEQCYVYIVTKLQSSGGHTRVIEDFVRARPNEQHVILSTELSGRSDKTYIDRVFAKQYGVCFESAPSASFVHRLSWLQGRLLEISCEKVYLFNHHQDSVAVAAVSPEMDVDAYFYHHCDHHLCLGVTLSHLEHIDFHPMGYQFCKEELELNNSYVPLVVADRGRRPIEWPFRTDGLLTTCTVGRSNKVEQPYHVSYLEVVSKILLATGGQHIHIGRLSPWGLYRIRKGLRRAGVSSDRFIYIPWVQSVWHTLHEYRVDLYIASFPYGGGLTLLEAMGAGTPVALHNHMFSRVLGSIELAYPEVFSWRTADELVAYCSDLTAESLARLSLISRDQYENFHTEKVLQSALDGRDIDLPVAMGEARDFRIQRDEWGLWMSRQVSFRGVISRLIYRVGKWVSRRL